MNATVKPDEASFSFAPVMYVYPSAFPQSDAEAAFIECQEINFRKLEILT